MHVFEQNEERKLEPAEGPEGFLKLCSGDEIREGVVRLPHHKEILHSLGSIRYCKAERIREGMLGTLRIPGKSERKAHQLAFAFLLTAQTLTLVEDAGELLPWIEKQLPVWQEVSTTEDLFLKLLEQSVSEDSLFLCHLEQQLEQLEDVLIHRVPPNFFETLTAHRRKLSELGAYYDQLTTMGERMRGRRSGETPAAEDPWEYFLHDTKRLQDHVRQMKEALHQLREMYQFQQTARQNRVMGMLTVVTTVFLPLNLLTGWYGMNFTNMPELQWQYGYPVVIAAAVVIVLAEIIYFTHKKYF